MEVGGLRVVGGERERNIYHKPVSTGTLLFSGPVVAFFICSNLITDEFTVVRLLQTSKVYI